MESMNGNYVFVLVFKGNLYGNLQSSHYVK